MTSMNRTLVIVAVVFALVVGGLLTYVLVKRWHDKEMYISRQQTQHEYLEMLRQMTLEMDEMRAKIEAQRPVRPADDVFPTVFGAPAPEFDVDGLLMDCGKLEAQAVAFFDYLDNRPYLVGRKIDGGTAALFRESAALLAATPPANVAEMQDLFRLLKNVTHLYRVLGRDRLLLIKDIMAAEDRVLEPAMAVFYALIAECRLPLPGDDQPIDFERLYDYAGFFLNTMGGRSYLLRRESTQRILVNYYATLIVDRANDEKFNRYGIDVRPYIDHLLFDITNQRGLSYRERYLAQLSALRDKYN